MLFWQLHIAHIADFAVRFLCQSWTFVQTAALLNVLLIDECFFFVLFFSFYAVSAVSFISADSVPVNFRFKSSLIVKKTTTNVLSSLSLLMTFWNIHNLTVSSGKLIFEFWQPNSNLKKLLNSQCVSHDFYLAVCLECQKSMINTLISAKS